MQFQYCIISMRLLPCSLHPPLSHSNVQVRVVRVVVDFGVGEVVDKGGSGYNFNADMPLLTPLKCTTQKLGFCQSASLFSTDAPSLFTIVWANQAHIRSPSIETPQKCLFEKSIFDVFLISPPLHPPTLNHGDPTDLRFEVPVSKYLWKCLLLKMNFRCFLTLRTHNQSIKQTIYFCKTLL